MVDERAVSSDLQMVDEMAVEMGARWVAK